MVCRLSYHRILRVHPRKEGKSITNKIPLVPIFCHFNKAKPGYTGIHAKHTERNPQSSKASIRAKCDSLHLIKAFPCALVDCNLQMVMQSCRYHWKLDIAVFYLFFYVDCKYSIILLSVIEPAAMRQQHSNIQYVQICFEKQMNLAESSQTCKHTISCARTVWRVGN